MSARSTVLAATVMAVVGALAACGTAGERVRTVPPGTLDVELVTLEPAARTVSLLTTSVSTSPAPTVAATVLGASVQAGDEGPRWQVDEASATGPFPDWRVEGMLTFRGNPTRSLSGVGPVPDPPVVRWTYPPLDQEPLCRASSDGGEVAVWCGTGWTGQPALWRWADRWAVAFGAYDGAVHVLDAVTGEPLMAALQTGDLIKGSVTIDPDGFPLLYTGSRDDQLRVVALDRGAPVELWRLSADAVTPTLWNDDWDASPLVLGDLLLEGGENGQFHVIKLNRSFGPDGRVRVDPRLVFNAPAWDAALLADTGSTNVSVESSVAAAGRVAYTANSGGLIVGWDLGAIVAGVKGEAARTFRFWMGDDTDATVVIDEQGDLYVAAEYERGTARADEVGQLAKLDPRQADQPLVWSVPLRNGGLPSGVWSTPALWGELVIVTTHAGDVAAFDRSNGALRWQFVLPGPTWSSPVVAGDTLVQGDCAGVLHGYDLGDGTAPPVPRWSVELGGCIESTPAVYGGMIVVGTRGGRVFGLAGA